MTPEERQIADPFRYLEKNGKELQDLAVWLIHREADITVPIPSSNRLYASMGEVPDQERLVYCVVPHMGHASDPLYAARSCGDRSLDGGAVQSITEPAPARAKNSSGKNPLLFFDYRKT